MTKKLMALWLLLLGTVAVAQLPEIKIADSQGAFGHPNPYHHYPRGPGYVRMSFVFDTLVWKDAQGFVPALAKTWTYDAPTQSYVFDLQPEATWHDGAPFGAEDVAFTIGYFKEHPYYWIDTRSIGEVTVEGPHRVRIALLEPYAPFLSDIGGTMPILPKHIWEGVKDPKAFLDAKAFIGSGPYMYRDFDKTKGTYLYEAFEGYYGGKPKAKRLIYVKTDNPLSALLSGSVDMATIRPQMLGQVEKVPHLQVIEDERSWNKKLMINHRKAPFASVEFRQALAYGIDRVRLINQAHQGHAKLASLGLLSPDHPMAHPALPAYGFDAAKALELLGTLGYVKNAQGVLEKEGKPLHVTLLSSSITSGGQVGSDRDGEMIAAMLRDLGMQVELIGLEQTTLDARVRAWEFDLAVSGHGGISGDAKILNEMILPWGGAGSVNSARYDTNPALNSLLEAQLGEMDEAKRTAMVQEIQLLHATDLPAIALYYPKALSAYDTRKGVTWFYTKGGIAKGVPIPQNKRSLLP